MRHSLARYLLTSVLRAAADDWGSDPKPQSAPPKTSPTPKTTAPTPNPSLTPNPSSAVEEGQQEVKRGRGRPPANGTASAPKAPAAPPKPIEEMSVTELTKALAKEAAKAKAGHEALAQIELINAAIQAKLG